LHTKSRLCTFHDGREGNLPAGPFHLLFRVKEATMKHAIVLSLILLAGCTVTRPPGSPDAPELISMSPLPVFSSHNLLGDIALDVVFHVHSDGRIINVKFTHSSGDAAWDELAIDSMKHWRFTPISTNDTDEIVVIRSRVIVRMEIPAVMSLGLLAVSTAAEADTLYAQLKRGAEFATLANSVRWDSPLRRGRYTGPVDVGIYPQHVRNRLRKLGVNEITEPIRLGAEYIIYRRLADTRALPQ
jgi:TonB family protein